MTTVTPEEVRAMLPKEPKRRHKYGARRAYLPAVDRWFASVRERDAAAALLIRQQQGEIRGLRFQAPYDLVVNGQIVCRYIADFVFAERWQPPGFGEGWRTVVADAKGFRTDVYKLKRALMKACHGIEIREL